MGIDWPITAAGFLSVFGVAFVSGLIVQWLKAWVKEGRIYNLITLAIAETLAMLTQFVLTKWRPSGELLISAALMGFFGASLACYGYETIQNILGLIGFGKRATVTLPPRG